MDILSALNVLRTATDDALKCYTAETLLTLRKVGERLNASLLPSTPCDNASEVSAPSLTDSIATPSPPSGSTAEASPSPRDVTASESSSRDGCTTEPLSATRKRSACNAIAPPATASQQKKAFQGKSRKAPEDLVSKLGRGIERTTPWIWDTSKEDFESVLSRKRKPGEDRRLEDVRRVEGDPDSSDKDKLLRLLAIRSLATEFTTEQLSDKSPTRVDELTAYVLSIEPGENGDQQNDASLFRGRGSAVPNFVERLPNISSKPLANRAINSGIKYLVFEKVLKHRLQEFDLPEICEAISAILGLNIQNFRILPYKRMPDLVDTLLLDSMHISLQRDDEPEKEYKRHILDIIRDVTPWFTRLQANYDGERRT